MVASPASAKRFAPADRPRISVAGDGTVAAICEPARVVITELPSCAAFAELAVDVAANDVDVAWVGTPPRLLVCEFNALGYSLQRFDRLPDSESYFAAFQASGPRPAPSEIQVCPE